MTVREKLKTDRIFFDGGMGTMLQKNGVVLGEYPELLNVTRPDVVEKIHTEYFAAGCDIATTNTFGANEIKMKDCEKTVEEIITAAVTVAKRAASRFEGKYVALDMGPLGQLLEPMGAVSFEDAYHAFARSAVAGEKAGADLIIIETMSDTLEMKAAVCAVKQNTALPVVASMTYSENGKTLTGGSPWGTVALLEALGVDAVGYNCGNGLEEAKAVGAEYLQYASFPILMQPNAGLPHECCGKVTYDTAPTDFAEVQKRFCEAGVSLLGGCCGTTPEHLAAVIKSCKALPVKFPAPKEDTVITSYHDTLSMKDGFFTVGARIQPHNKEIAGLLQEGDIDALLDEVFDQQDCGANAIALCTDMPGVDQADVLVTLIRAVQEVISLPLLLETEDLTALEAGLRAYNGKAAVVLHTQIPERLAQAFNVIKSYGAVVIMALDSPEEERAARFMKAAQDNGLVKKDLAVAYGSGAPEEDTLFLHKISQSHAVTVLLRCSPAQELSDEQRARIHGCCIDPE